MFSISCDGKNYTTDLIYKAGSRSTVFRYRDKIFMSRAIQIMQVIHIPGLPINLFDDFDDTSEIIIRIPLSIYPSPKVIIKIDVNIFK